MKCRICGVSMVPRSAWDKGLRPDGYRPHRGRSLCSTHYRRAIKEGTLGQYGLLQSARTRQEVLEDYMLIRDEVSSIEQAAARMGMTASALEKALERARKAGSTEALTPNQLRGTIYNQHFNRRSA